MASKEKLPWDLVEDILSRVPPKPLVRFRTVCKRWNTLFGDKTFINNHKMTFQFILVTKSKIYSVSLNPEIEVRELPLDIPGLKHQIPDDFVDCNGLLLCGMDKGAVIFNPWLGNTRCIHAGSYQPRLNFIGIGYDNDRRADKIVYKTLAYYLKDTGTYGWKIHDFATCAWEDLRSKEAKQGTLRSSLALHSTRGVSLNGSLYWVAYYRTHPKFVLYSSSSSIICDLPCGNSALKDALVLRVYKGVRLSLLKQCHVTKKINIWVTKNNIASRCHKKVKWENFMEVSIPNLPDLVQTKCYPQPSYFIDDKRNDKKLVVCSCDVNGRPWIYVVAESKLISKTRLDSVVDPWPLHCACFPSLVAEPLIEDEGALQLPNIFPLFWLFVWLFGKLKSFFAR